MPDSPATKASFAASEPLVFGLRMSRLDARGVAQLIVGAIRKPQDGPGLVVTPNIHHVAMLRTDTAFAAAYAKAEVVTCDGFPVFRYAKLRGASAPGRVTGCDIVTEVMRHPDLAVSGQRLFFVLDHADTETAVRDWAARLGLSDVVQTAIPAFGFERDEQYCRDLAQSIANHGTTILFMGVGAPKSEVFVAQYSALLPACWALCIGQAVKMELGLTPRPPQLVIALNLEWLWRIFLEPRRLIGRYTFATLGFTLAILDDLRQTQTSH